MANLTADEAAFVQGVSQQTGIDPRVLIAWIASEGHPGDLYHNYLNIQTPTAQSLGIQTVGTAAANTAEFGDVQTGIRATSAEIKSLGLTRLAGQTPSSQISQIAASPWASSHYGGPGGPNLRNTFASIFSSAGLNSPYEGPDAAGQITGDINVGGSAATPGLFGSGTLGGAAQGVYQGSGAQAAVKAVTGPINSIEGLIKFVTSWRFYEILGGFALLLVGLILLGRQFGVSAPGAAAVASRVPGA